METENLEKKNKRFKGEKTMKTRRGRQVVGVNTCPEDPFLFLCEKKKRCVREAEDCKVDLNKKYPGQTLFKRPVVLVRDASTESESTEPESDKDDERMEMLRQILEMDATQEAAPTSTTSKEDACIIAKSLVKLKHKSKDSASPSEVYFAVTHKNEIPVSIKAFLDEEMDKAGLGGLKYEIKVYDQIINEILEQKYSPNFIGFVAQGECSVNSSDLVQAAFDELEGSDEDTIVNLLMTQLAGGGKNPIDSLENVYPKLSARDKLEVMFQIVYSLRVMNIMRFTHNDLHAGNVLVEELPEKTTRYYHVPGRRGAPGKTFTIRTKYVPLLFDWDLAYAEQLGPNPKIDDFFCRDLNICNRFSEKTDLYILTCTLNLKRKLGGLVEFQEGEIVIEIDDATGEVLEDSTRFNRGPYLKMSGKQLQELSRGTLDAVVDTFGKDSSLTFTLDYDDGYIIKLHSGFSCRPSSFSSEIPTPEEELNSEKFKVLESGKDGPGPTYSLPTLPGLMDLRKESGRKGRVFIDPFRVRTDAQIKKK